MRHATGRAAASPLYPPGMPVTALREITVGVRDLPARTAIFETGCVRKVIRTGPVTSIVASRLFDTHTAPKAAVMGRPDVDGSPRIRLIEAPDGPPARPLGPGNPGPLGIGFATAGIRGVHARLERSGVRFVSPPLLLTPATTTAGAPPGPRRRETFGRAPDGDYIVLIERLGAATPYGTLTTDCSEPLHASFVVTNLNACTHFMRKVLEHEVLLEDTCSGPPYAELLCKPEELSLRLVMPHRSSFSNERRDY